MSRFFGQTRQLGFVVRDIDAALRYWTEVLGVGPFFVFREVAPDVYLYRGGPSAPPTMSIALGNSGDVQIELIAQHTDEPSAYRDFLDAGREGLQHVSSWLTRADFDLTRERLLADGAAIVHEGGMADSDIRWAYLDTDTIPGGLQYEIADVLDSSVYPLFESLADMAKTWDGTDPVRELRR